MADPIYQEWGGDTLLDHQYYSFGRLDADRSRPELRSQELCDLIKLVASFGETLQRLYRSP